MTAELGQRVGFTMGALLLYRLGSFIPLPGVDVAVWARIFRSDSGGFLGTSSLVAGGADVHRLAVFALGLTPLLSAAMIIQLASMAFSSLRALERQGDAGRARLRRWTAGLTLALAVMQAIGVAGALERVPGLVIEPGLAFRLTAALTLTAGTMFLVWLSSQITARGVGNGFALILFAGIVADLPAIAAGILELGRMGAVSGTAILGLGALGIVLTGFVVFVELGVRRFAVNYRSLHLMLGSRERQGYLAFKINPAGVLIPSTLASWLLLLPVLLTTLSDAEPTSPWRALASQLTAPGAPLHLVFYGLAVIVCALFYGAFLLDADAMADDLAKRGAVLCEAELGEKPAEHLDAVLSRTTLLGATYLALMLLIPELLTAYGQVPFPVGGASLLIVVCAMLDLTAQLRWTPPPRLMGGLEDALGGERR